LSLQGVVVVGMMQAAAAALVVLELRRGLQFLQVQPLQLPSVRGVLEEPRLAAQVQMVLILCLAP
jgi:hypothetical protein